MEKTFVSNRVGEVHMHSNPNQWKHIPTDINPADIPTRLPKISDLADNSLWWNGPRFLSDSMTSWPKPFVPPTEVDDEAKNEFKKTVHWQYRHSSTRSIRSMQIQCVAPI